MARLKPNQPFELLGYTVQPGQRVEIELQAALLYTHSPLSIPIEII
ncbi:MAG: deacylase, partial [Photobacterium aquimaris]|nr:deacylase [Photobacterium aquimaris]